MKKPTRYLTGNRFAQSLLAWNLRKTTEMMGIGTGDNVNTSGEKVIIKKLRSLTPPPYTVFDVGANQGQFLGLVRKTIASSEYRIHCFEPAAASFQALEKAVAADERVILNNIGLGRSAGKYELYYNEPGAGIASLTKRRLDHFGIDFSRSETVTIDTLDNYCEQNGVDRIDLLKLDVEGHELDVLVPGSEKMFAAEAIRMVSFEFGGCNIDTRTFVQDFFYFFKEAGMRLFRITPAAGLYPINFYHELLEQFRTTNFLAVREKPSRGRS